jgi:hypothetical protein
MHRRRRLTDMAAFAVALTDELDASLRDVGRRRQVAGGVSDDDVLHPSGEDITTQRQLGRRKHITRREAAIRRRRRDLEAVDRQRQDRRCREIGKREALAAAAVAHLLIIRRCNLSPEPGLDKLAGDGDEPGQQRVVGIGKCVLPGLQPRLHLIKRREVAERHCRQPLAMLVMTPIANGA